MGNNGAAGRTRIYIVFRSEVSCAYDVEVICKTL